MYTLDLTFTFIMKYFVFSNTVIGTNRCLILRVAQSFVTLLNNVISPSIIDTIVIHALLIKHEAKIAGYWQSSFFAFLWIETKSRSLKTEGKNVVNIQPSGVHAWVDINVSLI